MNVKQPFALCTTQVPSLNNIIYWRSQEIKEHFLSKSNINSFNRFLKRNIHFKTLWTGQICTTHFLPNKFNARHTKILYLRYGTILCNIHVFLSHSKSILFIMGNVKNHYKRKVLGYCMKKGSKLKLILKLLSSSVFNGITIYKHALQGTQVITDCTDKNRLPCYHRCNLWKTLHLI